MKKSFKNIFRYFEDNGATILSFVAIGGVVTTAVLAVRSTPKALQLLEVECDDKGRDLTVPETIKVAGPSYIPSILCGMATIICILGANIINQRKQASLNSAYILLANSYQEYRNKVREKYGKDVDINIRKEILEDHKEELDDKEILFYDMASDRYFNRTWKEVLDAEYHLNRNFILQSEVTLNDFYEFLGLPGINLGDIVGWSISEGIEFFGYEWIDFEHTLTKTNDGLECYIIDMPFPASILDNLR